MDEIGIVRSLGISLGLGLIVGIERGWQARTAEEGQLVCVRLGKVPIAVGPAGRPDQPIEVFGSHNDRPAIGVGFIVGLNRRCFHAASETA